MKTLAISFVAMLLLAGCGGQVTGGQQGGDGPPPIQVDQAAAQEYLDQVQPILTSTAEDVARVADVNVQFDGGNVSVGLDPAAVEQVRNETQQGLDELRAIQPPPGLEETHQRLISAYEEGIPALNNFIQALQSGDAVQIAESVRNDLPKIQQLLSDIQTILEQLQQAAA